MAKLGFRYTATGSNLYIIITNSSNQHYNGTEFEDYDSTNWTDYDQPATEIDDYFYELELPSLDNGTYSAEIFLRAGVSADLTDSLVGQKDFSLRENEFTSFDLQLILITDEINEIKKQIAELTRAIVRFNV